MNIDIDPWIMKILFTLMCFLTIKNTKTMLLLMDLVLLPALFLIVKFLQFFFTERKFAVDSFHDSPAMKNKP